MLFQKHLLLFGEWGTLLAEQEGRWGRKVLEWRSFNAAWLQPSHKFDHDLVKTVGILFMRVAKDQSMSRHLVEEYCPAVNLFGWFSDEVYFNKIYFNIEELLNK